MINKVIVIAIFIIILLISPTIVILEISHSLLGWPPKEDESIIDFVAYGSFIFIGNMYYYFKLVGIIYLALYLSVVSVFLSILLIIIMELKIREIEDD